MDFEKLEPRARRMEAARSWIGLAAILLFVLALAVARDNPADGSAFRDRIHVPGSAVPALQAAGAPLIAVPVWRVAPEGDTMAGHAGDLLTVLMIYAGVCALLRRQWALLAAVATIGLAGHVLSPPRDPQKVWVLPGGVLNGNVLQPVQPNPTFPVFDPSAGVSNAKVAEPQQPVVAAWRLESANLDRLSGADAGYLRAQAAYLRHEPSEVARFLTPLGADAADDRVRRARTEAMGEYLRAKDIATQGPLPGRPAGLPFGVHRAASLALGFLCVVGMAASLVLDGLASRIRRRTKRLRKLQTETPAMSPA